MILTVEGVVLRRTDLGEFDGLFHLMTASEGKVRAVARAVKKPKSRLRGGLEPLTLSRVALYRGRNLDRITQVEPLESFPDLKGDLVPLAAAFLAVEWVDGLTRERDHTPGLYPHLVSCLYLLASGQDPERFLLGFEARLLLLLGYAPRLQSCVRCGREVRGGRTGFDAGEGGILCASCVLPRQQVPYEDLQTLQRMMENPLPEVRHLPLSPSTRQIVGRLLTDRLSLHLEHRPKSLAFWEEMRRGGAP